MNLTDRRTFLKVTAAGTVALTSLGELTANPDKKYKTALVGCGWWGNNILKYAMESGECKIVAVCDVDQGFLDATAERVRTEKGDDPKKYGDYRELLEKEKPDIVINATPDHWHPLITIAAVEAGAHVYVEKPVGHTIDEGKAMVAAARRHDRIVQVGTHRRVSPHNMSGMEFLKSGKAGKIGMVRAFVHYGGGPGEAVPDSDPPDGLDWDLWCGPAPLRPYNKLLHPKGFRNFLDYANGQIADWGVHWMDQILWWTEEKGPRKVSSTGDRHIRRDNTEMPDTQVATFEFEDFTACWEHRYYAANHSEKHNIGCYFYGTEGVFHMGWLDGWNFYPANGGPVVHEDPQLDDPDQQNIRGLWSNLLDCIKSGERPVCDIEIGHRSSNMSLLAMLSLKHGKSVEWDPNKEIIVGDEAASRLLRREYRSPWKYPEV